MSGVGTLAPTAAANPFGAFPAFGALVVLLAIAALPSLVWMVTHDWFDSQDYSHGALVPLIAAYLVRQRIDAFTVGGGGALFGIAAVVAGVCAILLGKLSTIHTLAQYGFLAGVIGGFAIAFGANATRRNALPLAMLAFMIPLPNFLYRPLSAQLQLWSSQLGVACLRAVGVSVGLHGNVIDLGAYQLQVLEACNGLRYLFPLLSLGALFGYLFNGPTWQRWTLFLSAIPVAIVLNSLRIATIGLTVERWGVGAAEGLVHDVEGWAVFGVCVVVLLVEAKLLLRVAGRRGSLLAGFDTVLPDAPARIYARPLSAPRTYVAAFTIVCAAIVLGVTWLRGGDSVALQRRAFAEFPMMLDGGWIGRRGSIDAKYLDVLQLDDYLMATYVGPSASVGFYSAFYGSQLAGRSAHSPRSCLPGDGWEISNLTTIELVDPTTGRPAPVNRAVIVKGAETQLVYYWFQQRGRMVADEYLVKWYILTDSLRRGRSDGALVRMTTSVMPAGGLGAADATLREFYDRVASRLPAYVPS